MLGAPSITGIIIYVDRKTLSTRKVSVTSGAASVPDEIFHRAKGVQLCNTQASQCSPAFFADSFFLNQFSFDVIQDRPFIPPTARVICERHMISVVPVTRHHVSSSSIFQLLHSWIKPGGVLEGLLSC